MTSYAAPAPRAGTGTPGGPSGFARAAALVFWVVVPVLCVLGVLRGVWTWTDHAHRQVPGIPGTFLVENRSCDASICLATGTFVSQTGDLVMEDITGLAGWGQNTRHSVVFDPSTPQLIVPLPTRWNPTAAIVSIAGGTVLLGAWGVLVFGVRRHEPAAGPAPAGPRLA